MRKFTHDVEAVELTAKECRAYADIVSRETHFANQHTLSCALEAVVKPVSPKTTDYISARVYLLWRRSS